jgi:hypothetical protein
MIISKLGPTSLMSWTEFIGGVTLGAAASFVIGRFFYRKSAKDQKSALHDVTDRLRAKNTLADFEIHLQTSSWRKMLVDSKEVWVADTDNTVQIQVGDSEREFKESWTTCFPDKTAFLYPVYLKIGAVVIRQLDFVWLDGGRIFVPVPNRRPSIQGGIEYFWNVNSLDFLVCNIVGSYYIYDDLSGVARASKAAIVR